MKDRFQTQFNNRPTRCIDHWGDCGTIVGWSKPIPMPCPVGRLNTVGGYWWVKRDRDGATLGTHPEMITICRECPKGCRK